ncbi:MAG TPA: serine hydrolase domain-containing protein [Vicinamibacteria bacterium]
MNETKGRTAAAAALLALLAGPAGADGPPTTNPPQPSLSLKARIDFAVAFGRAEGAWERSLVVGAISGSQAGVYYYGATPQDVPSYNWTFRIGSITKTMTAALLALQEHSGMRVGACGQLTAPTRVQDKLDELCPGCDPLPWQRAFITVSQLATHHAGLTKRPPVGYCTRRGAYESLSASSYDESARPPECAEGTREEGAPDDPLEDIAAGYRYSNWGFTVLGQLLTDNAGYSSWTALDRDQVLGPLGMTHTKVNGESFAGLVKAPRSSCDASGCTTLPEQPFADISVPAGGLWSTGPDMMRYLRFAMNLPALEPSPAADRLYAARSLIFCSRASGKDNYDETAGWMGLGWNRNTIGPADPGAPATDNPNDLIWWKGGDWSTYHAYIAFSPAKNVGVFVLSNTDHPDSAGPGTIGRHLLRSF